MAVTIRNKRMRQGELRFALRLVAMGAILGGIIVAVFLLVRWDEPLDAQARWTVAIVASLPCLIPLLLYIATPRELLRMDESRVQSVICRWRGYRRFSTRWSEVQHCYLGDQFFGVAVHGQRIELRRQLFAKEDWELMRAELKAHLTPYFDFDAPTRYDLWRQRQLAWSIWRKVLDKIALVGVVVWMFGPFVLGLAVARYFGLAGPIAIGVIVCVSVMPNTVVWIATSRYAQRRRYERWHDRRVEPVG